MSTRILDNAHILTYSAGGAGILVFGLHLNEWAAIVSILGVICGVAVQLYAAQRKLRWLERQQVVSTAVMGAMAAGNRATAQKADTAMEVAKKAADAVDGAS